MCTLGDSLKGVRPFLYLKFKGVKAMDSKTVLLDAIYSADFIIFISLFVAGTVTLAMKKRHEKVSISALVGELVLAAGVGVICWFSGLYAGMDSLQISLVALPSAYGQVKLVTKLFQVKNELAKAR